jgi:hypothetical protein
MRGKFYGNWFGKIILLTSAAGIIAISSVIIYQFSVRRTIRPASNSQILPSSERSNLLPVSGTGAGNKIDIAYPTSTNICVNGCNPHRNWIEFYLATGSYIVESLKLRTTLFPGQVLTLGISSTPCYYQEKAEYTCLEMQLSHNLLTALTGLKLIPLGQLRDPDNWWLEYEPER